jgi:hypothetical protein
MIKGESTGVEIVGLVASWSRTRVVTLSGTG